MINVLLYKVTKTYVRHYKLFVSFHIIDVKRIAPHGLWRSCGHQDFYVSSKCFFFFFHFKVSLIFFLVFRKVDIIQLNLLLSISKINYFFSTQASCCVGITILQRSQLNLKEEEERNWFNVGGNHW